MQGELNQPGTDTAANSIPTGGSYLLALVTSCCCKHYYLCLWNHAQQEYWIHLAFSTLATSVRCRCVPPGLNRAWMAHCSSVQVTHGLEVAAVLSGPAQGATVLSPQAMQAYEAQQSAAAATAHTPALEHGHHQGSTHQGWGQEMSGMHSDPHVERVLLGDSASSDKISSSTGEGKVHTVKGSEVSQQLSAFKVVSAVMDVDAQQEFHDSLLASFRQ